MTPGSLLIGNAGDCFCCGHEHGTGDRCLSFSYAAPYLDAIASGSSVSSMRFQTARLPALRALAPLAAKAILLAEGVDHYSAEEVAIELAATALRIAHGVAPDAAAADEGAISRVTRVVRMIDADRDAPQDLVTLARQAGLSVWHFLRLFEAVTGTTPHQYLLRHRLRRAAVRLRMEPSRILDIALDCGFNDVSNFNRAFRSEFGLTPRAWRSA
jgi:AraC family transcriptional regulator